MRVWTLLLLAACVGETPTGEECAEDAKILVYADNDEDGYGASGTQKSVCPPLDPQTGEPSGEIPRGFSANEKDCDDGRSEVNPVAIEQCNGLDDDCDEESDEGLREVLFFVDADQDGFGNPESDLGTLSCAAPAGYVDNGLDCDDGNAAIHPDAIEVCDAGEDNDCDDRADDLDPTLDLTTATAWYVDEDGDTFGDEDESVVQCERPTTGAWVANADDCDDADIDVRPTAEEVCNRVDDDCDQRIDDSDPDIRTRDQSTWYADADGDGFGDPGESVEACWQPWFYVGNTDDCDDENPYLGLPAAWVRDLDGDGFGAGTPSAPDCVAPGADWVLLVFGLDCDDDPATGTFSYPGGNEVCDGSDNNCDDETDDEDDELDLTDPATLTFYRDADGDSFGDEDQTVVGCAAPAGYVSDDQDCDDRPGIGDDVNPNGVELCDGFDNDCDFAVDDQDSSVDPGSALTWYQDFDGDDYGDASFSIVRCEQPPFHTDTPGDCDDTEPAVNPGEPEVCGDGLDNDCVGGDATCFAPAGAGVGRRSLPATLRQGTVR